MRIRDRATPALCKIWADKNHRDYAILFVDGVVPEARDFDVRTGKSRGLPVNCLGFGIVDGPQQ